MRVFVTGATGWVGSAVIDELLATGHAVLGMARSDEGEAKLAERGVPVLRGSLQDLDSLQRGAADADAIIHCAFSHDFSRFAENGADEKRAIEAMTPIAADARKPFIITSGVALVSPGRLAIEDAAHDPTVPIPRDPETVAKAAAARGARVSIMRLSASVHGAGDHGFVPFTIEAAQRNGRSVYVGEGANRWPAVHRRDAARLYRLALERAADLATYHAVADEGVPFVEIARVIARRLKLPLASVSAEEAAAHFGWFAMFAGIDAPASSARTRATLGWEPSEPGLLADVDSEAYFPAAATVAR